MKIIGLPALIGTYDNYIWILSQYKSAWVVDPGESSQVIDYLKLNNLDLKAILITHNHFDHVDGILEIKQHFPNAKVYGADKNNHPSIQTKLKGGDIVNLLSGLSLRVMETPGHTVDHITFYNEQWLFCGDTLFTGGCGRELGGGYENFANSILKIRQLPEHLEFYCGHEYTEDNLAFARWVDPSNKLLQERCQHPAPSYPNNLAKPQSTLKIEKTTNPFMRFDEATISAKLISRGANKHSPTSLFKTLRDWKDDIDKNGLPN